MSVSVSVYVSAPILTSMFIPISIWICLHLNLDLYLFMYIHMCVCVSLSLSLCVCVCVCFKSAVDLFATPRQFAKASRSGSTWICSRPCVTALLAHGAARQGFGAVENGVPKTYELCSKLLLSSLVA